MPRWSTEILTRFVAPGITDLVTASVPDLHAELVESQTWASTHFLNNVRDMSFGAPWRQYAINLLRRGQTVVRFYEEGRERTLAYLRNNDPFSPKIAEYYDALVPWESLLLNWAICLDIVKTMNGANVFQPKDGSAEERAYSLHNTLKHHADDIKASALAGDDVLPVWLTSTGLRSKTREITYDELAVLVRDIAKVCAELVDARGFIKAGR